MTDDRDDGSQHFWLNFFLQGWPQLYGPKWSCLRHLGAVKGWTMTCKIIIQLKPPMYGGEIVQRGTFSAYQERKKIYWCRQAGDWDNKDQNSGFTLGEAKHGVVGGWLQLMVALQSGESGEWRVLGQTWLWDANHLESTVKVAVLIDFWQWQH